MLGDGPTEERVEAMLTTARIVGATLIALAGLLIAAACDGGGGPTPPTAAVLDTPTPREDTVAPTAISASPTSTAAPAATATATPAPTATSTPTPTATPTPTPTPETVAFEPVAHICDGAEPLRLPGGDGGPAAEAAALLGAPEAAPVTGLLCDFERLEPPREIAQAVQAALASHLKGDRDRALDLVQAAIRAPGSSSLRFGFAAARGAPLLRQTRALVWLGSAASQLGDAETTGQALEGATETFGQEAPEAVAQLHAEASELSVRELLEIAADAQLLGDEELADGAIDQARSTYEAIMRLKFRNRDPCQGTLDDLREILETVAQGQRLGVDEAVTDAGLDLAGAALKGIAGRAASGESVGMSAIQLTEAAMQLGLTESVSADWYTQDACAKNWNLWTVHDGVVANWAGGVKIQGEGLVPITVADDGSISGQGSMQIGGEAVVGTCRFTLTFSEQTMEVSGQRIWRDTEIVFRLQVEQGPATLTSTSNCPGGNQPAESSAITLPMTLAARHGAQHVIEYPRIALTQGTITFELLLVD